MVLPSVIAALSAVAGATLSALILALGHTHLGDGTGLNAPLAWTALAIGALTGAAAFRHTRRLARAASPAPRPTAWAWLMFGVFALFAVRAFCWLMYWDGDTVRILSPNNLGDLPRHLLYARFFADGAPWWPPHPLHAWASLRYYPGIDLFGSLLLLAGMDERQLLVWVGLGGSAAAAVALWRWGGAFTMAALLFNGGLAGWEVLRTGRWLDYQGPLAWKSLPLAIFVTQRGFLFALPVGLLLLAHWRERMFRMQDAGCRVQGAENFGQTPALAIRHPASSILHPASLLPFWVEALLLVALPFFQLYAALFLLGLLGWWGTVYFGRVEVRQHVGKLLAVALLPIVAEAALMTGGFARGHSLWLKPGWMQGNEAFWKFWAVNFGLSLPLAAGLWIALVWRLLVTEDHTDGSVPREEGETPVKAAEAFVLPAGVAFLTTCVVMFAPWEWDNTKLMLWAYLAAAPFVWERLLAARGPAWQVPVCGVLFFSGYVSLVGGLGAGKDGKGLELARRSELDAVRAAVRAVPAGERFACSPDYNHPLVLDGRMVAMGYAGALLGYGLDYKPLEKTLRTLMLGVPGWENAARQLGVRYVFWGPREDKHFPKSTRPWESGGHEPLARGEWGAIYELPP